jgi:uncharacterized protein
VADLAGAGAGFAGVLTGFAAALRAAGMAVGSGDVLVYARGLGLLDPADLVDLYWAGRVALVKRHEDVVIYDEVFRRFFLGGGSAAGAVADLAVRADPAAATALAMPSAEPGAECADEAVLGWLASDVDALKRKSFTACTPEELAALRRIMRRIRLTPPRRRTRRYRPAPPGRHPRAAWRPDPRRTIRAALRTHGEPARLHWRQRKVRLRPLILILDISGSMADYSRALLQFAHCAKRAASGTRVEVFCFGTRLTRVTGAMASRRPDSALDRAARVAFDWDGGTRIGDSLAAFVRDHARRGLARGGIVVVCSDGLDRGDPAVLDAALERLSLLCHRLVWVNPHGGFSGGAGFGGAAGAGGAADLADAGGAAVGMMVARPHLDLLLPGHDLRSLERLAALLPVLG